MSNAKQAPDFKPGNPSQYARLGPGWQVIWDGLPIGEWVTAGIYATNIAPYTGLAETTVNDLIRMAVRHRTVRRRRRAVGSRTRLQVMREV